MTPRKCFGMLLVLLGSGCSEPEGCDICTTSAIVYGRVVDANGAPVTGTPVVARAYQQTCSSGNLLAESDPGLLTGSDGQYRLRLRSVFGPATGCPRVTAGPVEGSSDSVTAEGTPVEFRPDYGKDQPRDSARIDVTLPAAVQEAGTSSRSDAS